MMVPNLGMRWDVKRPSLEFLFFLFFFVILLTFLLGLEVGREVDGRSVADLDGGES